MLSQKNFLVVGFLDKEIHEVSDPIGPTGHDISSKRDSSDTAIKKIMLPMDSWIPKPPIPFSSLGGLLKGIAPLTPPRTRLVTPVRRGLPLILMVTILCPAESVPFAQRAIVTANVFVVPA